MLSELIGAAAGWFSDIPDVVWSGVISAFVAATVALLGVWATNRGSLNRLRKQHAADAAESETQRKHDAFQKTEDRKGLIRREVYTAAVEATHTLIASLARLPERASDAKDDDEAMQRFLAANSKIWLVANLEGAQLSRQLATEAGEAFVAILRNSHDYRVRMDSVRDLAVDIDFASAEAVRIAQKNMDAKISGESKDAFDRGADAWDEVKEWRRNRWRARASMLEALSEEKRSLALYCLETLKPLQATLVKLVSSLRFELELEPALDIFEALAANQKARMDALMGTPAAAEAPAAS